MYKPKTTHYLFSYEYLADRYGCERPFGMCPDEWDMKILNCPPDKYIDCFGGLDYVMRYDDYSHHYTTSGFSQV